MTPRQDRLADVGRGITLCHDGFGNPADQPIVLIAGLGQQLHSWPSDFAAALAARGFRVVRFDNRDVGRSTHMDYRAPTAVAVLRGPRIGVEYAGPGWADRAWRFGRAGSPSLSRPFAPADRAS